MMLTTAEAAFHSRLSTQHWTFLANKAMIVVALASPMRTSRIILQGDPNGSM